MTRIIKMLTKHFIKTVFGPMLSIALPIALLFLLGNIFKIEYVLPGIISLSIIILGVISLPVSIVEFRDSSIMKFIGSTKFSKHKFIASVFVFYFIVSFIALIIIVLFSMIIFEKDVFPDNGFKNGVLSGIFSSSGSISFFIAIILHIFFTLSVGILISVFSKTMLQALSIGISIMLAAMFLAGIIIPVDIIAKSDVLQGFSRAMPFRYSTGNIVISSTPLNQTSDLLDQLSLKEKELLFDNDHLKNSDKWSPSFLGAIPLDKAKEVLSSPIGTIFNDKFEIVHSHSQLLSDISSGKFNPDHMNNNQSDIPLFKIIFMSNDALNVSSSSNNIFQISEWGVKKIMTAEEIKAFVLNYLGGDPNKFDANRFKTIYTSISHNDFTWLDLFFSFTKTLYTKVDKVFNIIIPLLVSPALIYISLYKFRWSS